MLIQIAVLALAGITAYLLYRSWRHAAEVAELADQVHELRGKVRLFGQYGPKLALLLAVCLSGCGGAPADVVPSSPSPFVAGIVTNVQVSHEDSCNSTLVVEFTDGRIAKMRIKYSRPFVIQKDRWNAFFTDSHGTVERIDTREDRVE